MLENVLRNCSLKVKLTIKSGISVFLMLVAAFLPLLIHASLGKEGGATWLPMYLPVLLGGCLLGSIYGAAIGIASPIVSFFISQAVMGSAMPIAAKLPFMIIELAVFGIISGFFAKAISNKPVMAFPAVISAQTAGRLVFLLLGIMSGQSVFAAIQKGLLGLYIQAAFVPLIIIFLARIIRNDRH